MKREAYRDYGHSVEKIANLVRRISDHELESPGQKALVDDFICHLQNVRLIHVVDSLVYIFEHASYDVLDIVTVAAEKQATAKRSLDLRAEDILALVEAYRSIPGAKVMRVDDGEPVSVEEACVEIEALAKNLETRSEGVKMEKEFNRTNQGYKGHVAAIEGLVNQIGRGDLLDPAQAMRVQKFIEHLKKVRLVDIASSLGTVFENAARDVLPHITVAAEEQAGIMEESLGERAADMLALAQAYREIPCRMVYRYRDKKDLGMVASKVSSSIEDTVFQDLRRLDIRQTVEAFEALVVYINRDVYDAGHRREQFERLSDLLYAKVAGYIEDIDNGDATKYPLEVAERNIALLVQFAAPDVDSETVQAYAPSARVLEGAPLL
ncbi:MAG TPA: hypothetical protein PLE43_03440 [Alphaproteobacteria bacterium]|nr:hypothetical protein [Alphaproteobacteria bacterium]